MHHKSQVLCPLFLGAIILLLLPVIVGAAPPAPATFYGTVKLDGQNIPDGTEISAWIAGVKYAQSPSFGFGGSSYYNLSVIGDDPDTTEVKEGGVAGETITFMIGSVVANETAIWQEGYSPVPPEVGFPLTGSAGTPTPTITGTPPTSTPTMTGTPTRTATRTATATNTRTTPTATPFPTTVVLRDSYVQDTYLDPDTPAVNYVAAGRLKIKYQDKRPLLRFNLEGIVPTGSQIMAATLQMHTTDFRSQADRALDVQVFGIKRSWVPDQVNWTQTSNATVWGAPGANDLFLDRDAVKTDSQIVDRINSSYQFNVTALVTRWVINPAENWGLVLIGEAQSVEFRFYSTEEFNPDYRPKLTITFIPPPPTMTPSPTSTPSATPTSTYTPTPSSTATNTYTPTATPTTGAISAIAWEDDGNRVPDPGEPRVANVLIKVSRNSSGSPAEATCETGADGECLIPGLMPGTYYVFATAPAGFEIIRPGVIALSIRAGHTDIAHFILKSLYTPTATGTATFTPTPTSTGTTTATASATSTATGTATASATITLTPTATGTPTWTPTSTSTPTLTPTFTPTTPGAPTSTFTPTSTATATPKINQNVIPIQCGVAYSGNSCNGSRYAEFYSCLPGESEPGPEVVYSLTTNTVLDIMASVQHLGNIDLDVMILDRLDPQNCVAGGLTEAIYQNAPPGTYYIVVDGYGDANSCGPYTLLVDCPGGPTPVSPTITSTPSRTPTGTITPTPSQSPTPVTDYLPLVFRRIPTPTVTPTRTPTRTQTPTPTRTATSVPPTFTPTLVPYDIATNCGGSLYQGTSNVTWVPDQPYGGGNAWGYIRKYEGEGIYTSTNPIQATLDDPLYQSNRSGVRYNFDLPGSGTYRVELKFAEIFSFYYQVGRRVFNVYIEGALIIPDLDVYALAGHDEALDFTFQVPVSDGQLNIDFEDRPERDSYGMVSAIRVKRLSN